jgi:stage II sporulation protein E
MIYNKYFENGIFNKIYMIADFIKKKIDIKSIIFFILSFVITSELIDTKFSLITFALFAVASVFNIPLILVFVSTILGILTSNITQVALLETIGFFVVFTFVTSIINIEGIGKKYAVFIKFMISLLAVQLISHFITGTILSNFFEITGNILVAACFYHLCVSGIYVILNLNKGYIYSREESVAMIAVIAIAMIIFKDITILNFSLFNILTFALILIYGWKKGSISGAAAGLVVGLMLTLFTNVNLTYVTILAFSGAIAGILSKFGKIAVITGIVIGNIYIAYYANGFSEITTNMSELLISSLILLFMPRTLEMKLNKLFNKNNTLNVPYVNILDSATSVKSRVEAISEIFDGLSNIDIEVTEEDSKETRKIIKKYIVDYVENSCISCTKRKECINEEKLNIIVDYIVLRLENNENIEKSYLNFDCEFEEDILLDIKEVYNSIKIMRILKQKEKENSVRLSREYKEVSKILSSISKNIKENSIVKSKEQDKIREELKFNGFIVYEDEFTKENDNIEYTFVTDILTNIDKQKKQITNIASNILEQNMTIKLILNSSKKEKSKIKIVSTPAFEIESGIASSTKTKETVSGDSYLCMELQDLKHLSVISDGVGSGSTASKNSSTVINMLEKLLAGGFNEEKSIEIINNIIKMKSNDTNFSTLDVAIVNLRDGEAEFLKLGAAPTYIIENSKVTMIGNTSIPVGLVKDTDYIPIVKKLDNNSIIIQVSDGVITEEMDKNDNYFTKILQNIDVTRNAKYISDELNRFVQKENKNILNDDMTIIVSKVKKV